MGRISCDSLGMKKRVSSFRIVDVLKLRNDVKCVHCGFV